MGHFSATQWPSSVLTLVPRSGSEHQQLTQSPALAHTGTVRVILLYKLTLQTDAHVRRGLVGPGRSTHL
jgi:hypothetical protein